MDSINRTLSVFTDKTNTITKNGVSKNFFSKPDPQVDTPQEEILRSGLSEGKCSSLFGCVDSGNVEDMFKENNFLKFPGDGHCQQRSASSIQYSRSIQSDHVNAPDKLPTLFTGCDLNTPVKHG